MLRFFIFLFQRVPENHVTRDRQFIQLANPGWFQQQNEMNLSSSVLGEDGSQGECIEFKPCKTKIYFKNSAIGEEQLFISDLVERFKITKTKLRSAKIHSEEWLEFTIDGQEILAKDMPLLLRSVNFPCRRNTTRPNGGCIAALKIMHGKKIIMIYRYVSFNSDESEASSLDNMAVFKLIGAPKSDEEAVFLFKNKEVLEEQYGRPITTVEDLIHWLHS